MFQKRWTRPIRTLESISTGHRSEHGTCEWRLTKTASTKETRTKRSIRSVRPSTSSVFDWLSEFCVRQVIFAQSVLYDIIGIFGIIRRYNDVVFNIDKELTTRFSLQSRAIRLKTNSTRYVRISIRFDSLHYCLRPRTVVWIKCTRKIINSYFFRISCKCTVT